MSKKKHEIIAAASKLFVEKGFEKTTMEDIANALGVYKGAIYYHIKSKADIFYEILVMSLDKSTEILREVYETDMEIRDKFRKIARVHFENIRNYSLEYQILLNERRYMLDPEREKVVRKKMKAYEDCFLNILKEGIAAGVFQDDFDPRVIVAGIMGVGNAIYKWFSFDGPLSFDDIADAYVDFFLNGIREEG